MLRLPASVKRVCSSIENQQSDKTVKKEEIVTKTCQNLEKSEFNMN